MSPATTIQEVINQLDSIIEDAKVNNNRLGLFAFVYRRTTAEVLKEVQLGNFENNELLQALDVAFANLYLDAYYRFNNKESVCKSWLYAFTHREDPLTIIQHIMLGMNSHINYDLALATSQIMKGKDINSIKNDFDKVNDILFSIVNELQDRLSSVSPMLFLLDWFGENSDEKIIDFSMRKARQQSWNSANLIWSLGENEQIKAIDTMDNVVLELSKILKSPKSRVVQYALKSVRFFESKHVGNIISQLQKD